MTSDVADSMNNLHESEGPVTWELIKSIFVDGEFNYSFPGALTTQYSYVKVVITNLSFDTAGCDLLVLGMLDNDWNIDATDHCSQLGMSDITVNGITDHSNVDTGYMKITHGGVTTVANSTGRISLNVSPGLPNGSIVGDWTGLFTDGSPKVMTTTGWGLCTLADANGFVLMGTPTGTVYPAMTMDLAVYGIPSVSTAS